MKAAVSQSNMAVCSFFDNTPTLDCFMAMLRSVSLSQKIILPLVIGGFLIIALVYVLLLHNHQKNVELAGLQTTETIAKQVKTLRSFYTNEVLERAKAAGMRGDHEL